MVNNPNIRFKGFTDEWVQRKFKDILKTQSFRSYLAGVSGNGEYEVIQQGDKPIVGYSDGEPFTDYKDVTLFGDHTVSLYKPKRPFFVATDGVKILSADNFEGDYLYTTLERYKPESQGYKRHFTILKNQNVWFTENMEEQQKIGSVFSTLDHKIGLEERQIELLKSLKKGLLQKMFPKSGATVPELRFAGFADDWEEHKLGELLKSAYQGINTAGDKVIYSEKGVEILQSKHITSGYITFDDTRFLDKKRYSEYFPKYVPKKHDILFANIGTIGPSTVVETNKEFLIAWNILKMTPNENVNSKFIELFLQILNEKHYYEKITTGNATKFVNKDAILNIELCISSFKEQQKIGSFFKKIDNTIALHQRKLNLLKDLKKGLLQQLFV